MTYQALKFGYACSDHPEARVETAVGLFTRKAIGLKWSHQEERDGLLDAAQGLSAEDRKKVRLVAVVR